MQYGIKAVENFTYYEKQAISQKQMTFARVMWVKNQTASANPDMEHRRQLPCADN